MEFFKNAKLIRLRSHTNKYLIADNDQEKVRQSSNISTHLANWTVESVNSFPHLIQLKSVHGLYLTVTEESVLLGREVIQAKFNSRGLINNATIQWEPIKEGVFIKLRCNVVGGMFLKGNGGLPPWRNTVTCDVSDSDKSVLWRVDLVESLFNVSTVSKDLIISNADLEPVVSDGNQTLRKVLSLSPIRVFRRKQRGGSSSSMDIDSTSPSMAARATFLFSNTFKDHHSLRETSSSNNLLTETNISESNLELFSNAKTVRLRSHHKKYLEANDDEENVQQGRRGSSKSARWNVEFVEGTNTIRLRSCYEKYLTATEETLLMFGMSGKKVMQTSRARDSSAEWEPFREGKKIKLKNRNGNFLNANGGSIFWKNIVTHDLPQKTAFQDWILWDVEILEIIPKENVEHENDEEQDRQQTEYESEETQSRRNSTASDDNNLPYESSESDSEVSLPSHTSSKFETNRSFQSEGRLIYYNVIKNEVEVDDMMEECCINFKGNGLEELKEILAEKSGLRNFIMCLKNGLNGELYPIKLQLPPNKTSMHVFLVPL